MLSMSMHQKSCLKDKVRDVVEKLMDEVIDEIDVTDYVTENEIKEIIGDSIVLEMASEIQELIGDVLDEG